MVCIPYKEFRSFQSLEGNLYTEWEFSYFGPDNLFSMPPDSHKALRAATASLSFLLLLNLCICSPKIMNPLSASVHPYERGLSYCNSVYFS